MNRVVNVSVLPGEPLDGRGKVCIHLLVPDDGGPFVSPCMLHVVEEVGEDGKATKKLVSRPTRCRLACSPTRTVRPEDRGSVRNVTMRTDDARAVTCPKCLGSAFYTKAMELLAAV